MKKNVQAILSTAAGAWIGGPAGYLVGFFILQARLSSLDPLAQGLASLSGASAAAADTILFAGLGGLLGAVVGLVVATREDEG